MKTKNILINTFNTFEEMQNAFWKMEGEAKHLYNDLIHCRRGLMYDEKMGFNKKYFFFNFNPINDNYTLYEVVKVEELKTN